MSADMFLEPTKEIERLESLVRTLKDVCIGISVHKTRAINGKESKIFYAAQLTGTRHNGEHIYKSIDGDSLPDLFSKISNQI